MNKAIKKVDQVASYVYLAYAVLRLTSAVLISVVAIRQKKN